MALSDDDIVTTIRNYRRLIGKGNGTMTIHFAGGVPQKIKADLDGQAINTKRLAITT